MSMLITFVMIVLNSFLVIHMRPILSGLVSGEILCSFVQYFFASLCALQFSVRIHTYDKITSFLNLYRLTSEKSSSPIISARESGGLTNIFSEWIFSRHVHINSQLKRLGCFFFQDIVISILWCLWRTVGSLDCCKLSNFLLFSASFMLLGFIGAKQDRN